MLKKITYPTGGSIEFTYGLNKFRDNYTQQVRNGSGIRIEQSKSSDAAGNFYYKTYEYETDGATSKDWGIMQLQPHPENMASESQYIFSNIYDANCFTADCDRGGTYQERIFYSGFLPALSLLAEKPVVYDKVTEYAGTKDNNRGKTVYKYDYFHQTPSPLLYATDITMGRYHIGRLRLWEENVLREKSIYAKAIGAKPYTLRKRVTNSYINIPPEEVTGFHVERTHVFPQDKVIQQAYRYIDLYAGVYHIDNRIQVYAYRSYVIEIGGKNLVSTSELDSTDTGQTILKYTDYTYNSRQLVSEIKTESSEKQTLVTQNKYPFDLPAETPHQEMINRNMLNFVVEQQEYKNTLPLQSVKTVYKDWGNNVIEPEIVSKRQGLNAYEPLLRFHAYNNSTGNLLRVSKENDVNISYIWGYKNIYPVAECRNATETEIFYNGFEENGTSGLAHTGNKFQVGDFNVPFVLPNAKAYEISFWYRENGGWKYSGPANYTGPVTLSLGRCH